MKAHYFVGCKVGQSRTVFLHAGIPTAESHPMFGYVIGPFRTRKAADLMASIGENNPHIRTVAEAERIAKEN